ncbi:MULTISPECIES: carph-isopro domain-containing protein [unclassified Bradyrhizobium]|uniref:carph-isopro domain-containing protein n=1 Tax=unclassified Bradyrhizobium TaxID=2631580 RepID=UPI0028F11A25|nr:MULTISPECIES: hypothetical protein [unclassified Bradyrhizobium]
MEKPYRTIRELIDAAGGPIAVSRAIPSEHHVSDDAVRKWKQNGIPDRYWPVIIQLASSCVEEIFAGNEMIRADKGGSVVPRAGIADDVGRQGEAIGT